MVKQKGQQDVLSAILVSGILIGVVSSVYFWGIPLIEKNRAIAVQKNAEDFMKNLNEKIKFVANNGGRDQIRIDVPGIIEVKDDRIELVTETPGTIYATEADIPLGRNECARSQGTWGIHDPSVYCVRSEKISETNFVTTNSLKYILLDIVESGVTQRSFKIDIVGASTGGQDRIIKIENLGVEEGEATKTRIAVDVL